VRIVPSDTGLLLIADADVLAAIQPKLQMFILRSQVALTPLTPTEGLMGLAGPSAEALLTQTVGSLPDQVNGLARAGDLHIIKLPGEPQPRYLLLAPSAQLADIWQQYSAALTRADAAFWQLLDIRAGLPEVTSQTQETMTKAATQAKRSSRVCTTSGNSNAVCTEHGLMPNPQRQDKPLLMAKTHKPASS
jgi:folate-binding Fe-S cluster repair protein YgfZ